MAAGPAGGAHDPGDQRRSEEQVGGRDQAGTIQPARGAEGGEDQAVRTEQQHKVRQDLLGEGKDRYLMLCVSIRQLQHAASWDPTTGSGGIAGPKLNRDSKNLSIGETVTMQPNCPPEPALAEVQPQQEVIGASSSDYSNSEDEYTHIEEPRPVSLGICFVTVR